MLLDVLDGTMIVLAMFTLNILHPGLLLGRAYTWSSREPSEADSEPPTTRTEKNNATE